MTVNNNKVLTKLRKRIRLLRLLKYVSLVIGIYGSCYLFMDFGIFTSKATRASSMLRKDSFNMIGMNAPDTSTEIPESIKKSFRKYGTKQVEKVERNKHGIDSFYVPEFQPIPLSLNLEYDTLMIAGINGIVKGYALQKSFQGPITVLFGVYKNFDLFVFDQNKIRLKFVFVDNDGEYIGHVFDNQLYINPTYDLGIAFDNRGLEVFDKNGNLIFCFFIAGPRQILFQGYLYDLAAKEIHVYGPKGMKHLPINCTPEDIRAAQRTVCGGRQFNYPANININTRLPDSLMPRIAMRPPEKTF